MGLLSATAVLVLGGSSAYAITIDFGVATIGGTISYAGPSLNSPLQDATSITFNGTSFEVSRVGMNDLSGLRAGRRDFNNSNNRFVLGRRPNDADH